MRKWMNRVLSFGLSTMVSLSVCDLGYADDGKAVSDSKPAAVKPVSESKPEAGLTDRERWLLERVEQLEKRVADLESKDAKPAVETSAVPGAGISNGMASTAKSAVSAPSATLTSASASAVPSSSRRVLRPRSGRIRSRARQRLRPRPRRRKRLSRFRITTGRG